MRTTCSMCAEPLTSPEIASYGGRCELCWLSGQPIVNKNPIEGPNQRVSTVRKNVPLRSTRMPGKRKPP